jgi:hypothetical protein
MIKRSLGILFIGALGSVATTVMAGNLAIRKGLVPIRGLITETEITKGLSLEYVKLCHQDN